MKGLAGQYRIRMSHVIAATAIAMFATWGGTASAGPDLTAVETAGSAPDGDQARTRALDVAFSRAVDKVVVSITGPQRRRQHRVAIRTQILRHARRFVASFRVTSSESREGNHHVKILAQVRRGKVSDALAKIGISGQGAAPAVVPAAGKRPAVALVLLSRHPRGTDATFGSAAGAGGAAGKELSTLVDGLGFARANLEGRPVPTATASPGALPLSDAAAAALARSAGAGIALVVGVSAKDKGRVRGTGFVGAAASVDMRVVDARSGAAVARTRVEAGGYAAGAAGAATKALRSAARRAFADVSGELRRRWPAPPKVDAAVLVSLTGVVGWGSVRALVRGLRATPGITAARVRRLQRGGLLLAVSGRLTPAQVVRVLRGVAVPVGTARVAEPKGKLVHVTLSGQPTMVTP